MSGTLPLSTIRDAIRTERADAMDAEIRPESAPLKVGEEFVRYQIRALIGFGDHAYVYEAHDPFLDRDVAIKVIPDPPNSQRDLVLRALEQDAVLRDLRHAHLTSVYEVGTIGDNLVYIVMEHIRGRTLRQLLQERHLLSPQEVTEIGIQVAEGLGAAHDKGVIHRDLKPENIFLLPDGTAKVINTGITSFIVPSGMVTERDRLRGTLLYMSPEHVQGFGVTEACDIYALGTVLYECLAGSPPVLIGSENLTLDDVVWRQVAHMPPRLDELMPEMPQYLARTIQQMLAKEAVLRFLHMEAVSARLREARRQILGGEEVRYSDFEIADAQVQVGEGKPTPSQVESVEREIAERAARLDSGLNSRCPPAMTQGTRHAPRRRVALFSTAVLGGTIAGLVIALFVTHPNEAPAERAPTMTAVSSTTQPLLAESVPPSSEPEPKPEDHAPAASPPQVEATLANENNTGTSGSYIVGKPAPKASIPRRSRGVIHPATPNVTGQKPMPNHANELVF